MTDQVVITQQTQWFCFINEPKYLRTLRTLFSIVGSMYYVLVSARDNEGMFPMNFCRHVGGV